MREGKASALCQIRIFQTMHFWQRKNETEKILKALRIISDMSFCKFIYFQKQAIPILKDFRFISFMFSFQINL